MKPVEAYQLYVSVRNHFYTEKYDHHFHRGRAVSAQSFDNRKDGHLFRKLAGLGDLEGVLVSAFCRSDGVYARDILEELGKWEDEARQFRKRTDGGAYWFEQDLRAIPDFWDSMLVVNKKRPRALQMMCSQEMHPVTASALDACTGCLDTWALSVYDPVTLPALTRRLRKLRGFCKITDIDALRKIVYNVVESANA